MEETADSEEMDISEADLQTVGLRATLSPLVIGRERKGSMVAAVRVVEVVGGDEKIDAEVNCNEEEE